MGRYASEPEGGDFTPAPPGTHVARCIRIVDIGTQHGDYQGEPTTRNQIIITWELPNELVSVGGEEKPAIISKFYTNSLHKKANLRADLEAWRSKPFSTEELLKFDLQNILDKPCLVTVVHNEKNRAKVASVSALAKGMSCPEAVNPPYAFWLDKFDKVRFAEFSDGIKRLIEASDEYKALFTAPGQRAAAKAAATQVEEDTDDIPF